MLDGLPAWFVPAVIAISAATFGAWLLFGPEPRIAFALVNAVAVLIIACPCALGLATPISIMVATGRGGQLGVLFRNAEAIESLRTIDTLAIDKTGTLIDHVDALGGVIGGGSLSRLGPWYTRRGSVVLVAEPSLGPIRAILSMPPGCSARAASRIS